MIVIYDENDDDIASTVGSWRLILLLLTLLSTFHTANTARLYVKQSSTDCRPREDVDNNRDNYTPAS